MVLGSTFRNRKFRSSSYQSSIASWYQRKMQKHPFAFFGLPFIAVVVAGSFFLTPATALRYERYDRKVQQMSQEDALGFGKNKRKFNVNEEYARLSGLKDLDNWEQKRIQRLPGEPDGTV